MIRNIVGPVHWKRQDGEWVLDRNPPTPKHVIKTVDRKIGGGKNAR